MFKNVASQQLTVFAFDSATGLPQTGDAANITAYVNKDYAGLNVLSDTSAAEVDATNAKGYYTFTLTQSETNADTLLFTAKSATAGIVVLGVPAVVFTLPPNFSSLSVDSNGRVDVIKIAGTTQTARDIGASVLLSSGTGTGQLDITSGQVKVQSGTGSGQLDVASGQVKVQSGTGSGQLDVTSGQVKVQSGTASGQILLSSGKVSLVTADMTTIAGDVWDVALSGHTTGGSTGAALNTAGAGTDPWSIALPGAYGAGTAGFLVGTYVNASVAAVKAKTDLIPASPAAVGDIPTATQNADALLKRDMSAVTGEASRSPLNALRFSGINKLIVSGGTLTAYKEDDSTPAATRTLGTDSGALPIVSSTP